MDGGFDGNVDPRRPLADADGADELEFVKVMVQLSLSPAKKTPSWAKVAFTEMGMAAVVQQQALADRESCSVRWVGWDVAVK